MSDDPRRRLRAEDSDSESDDNDKVNVNAKKAADKAKARKEEELRRLQAIDLGTERAGKLKQDGYKCKAEDRVNLHQLRASREAGREGTEAHAMYMKHRGQTAAWNNRNLIADNREEDFDPLDHGNSHRQRMRNEHGGRVAEPDEWEAGHAPGGRGGRGQAGSYGHEGRGGAVTRARGLARAATSAGVRGGAHTRGDSQITRPIAPTTGNSRPLDPAVQAANDPRSKYASSPARGRASGGRGGGNIGRGSGRPDSRALVDRSSTPARARAPTSTPRNTFDLVANPSAFMRAVRENEVAVAKVKAEKAKTAKAGEKNPTPSTQGRWIDAGAASPPEVDRSSNVQLIDVGSAPATEGTIRQVATTEFVMPYPHRGDTDSWTDGVQSANASLLDSSPSVASEGSGASLPAPLAPTNLVGLGIRGVETETRRGSLTESLNTANGVNLMDDDLVALNEPPISRAPLETRIIHHGAVYVLDESALGNASRSEVADPAPPHSGSTSVNRSVAAQTTPSLGSNATDAATNAATNEQKPVQAISRVVGARNDFPSFIRASSRDEANVSAEAPAPTFPQSEPTAAYVSLFVDLQKVGDAGYGMTPFRPAAAPTSACQNVDGRSSMAGSKPPPSTPVLGTSASRWAIGDETVSIPAPRRATGNGNAGTPASRWAVGDENVSPHQPNTRMAITSRHAPDPHALFTTHGNAAGHRAIQKPKAPEKLQLFREPANGHESDESEL